jgi:tetratricopeptide (TPR) repeat protein
MGNSIKNVGEGKVKSPYWFYMIVILIPILFFILLETGLRIFDYGRNDDQWISVTETKQMLNPDIGGRYFFNTKNFPQSNNEAFDIIKKKNAFRIFVLGGSSAAGFPYSPNGTFSRYIRQRLELLYPEIPIEVINVAITATNSYTIRDLLPKIIEQKPDLILIYAGHNEYYGALGVGSMENIGDSRRFVHFIIWINKFKTVELVRNLSGSISSLFSNDSAQITKRGGTLMARIVKDQLIEFNSEAFNTGINQFNGNLEDILEMAKESNIPVIIGTLVSNLKDQRPFVSEKNSDQESADSIYYRGQYQLNRKNFKLADSLLRVAKDLDALRFRAPEKMNSIIKGIALKYKCAIVNLDSAFNNVSPDGIVGNNLLVDHLHPTLSGYLLMGRIYVEEMKRLGYLPKEQPEKFQDAKLDSLVISDFAISRLDSVVSEIRLIGLLNDWPFVKNPNFSFLNDLELKDKIDSIAYDIAVENKNWEIGHKQAAEWYLAKEDYLTFAKEMNVLTSQYPFKLSDYDYAASQLINVKEYELAYNFLLKRFKEIPDAFSAKWLGNINLKKGNLDEAIKYLSACIEYDKTDAQSFYNLAGAYIQKEEFSNALQAIEKCLAVKPDFPNAQKLKIQLLELLAQ